MIHRLTFAAAGTRGVIVLDIPDAGDARFLAQFEGPEVGAGFLVVADDEVPRPRGALLEVRADGLWTEMICETPDEHWSFGLEAFGLRVDDPAETIGERIPVGYDLEWEVPDRVHGELLIGRAVIAIDARGTFRDRTPRTRLEVDGGEVLEPARGPADGVGPAVPVGGGAGLVPGDRCPGVGERRDVGPHAHGQSGEEPGAERGRLAHG